jgi:hypothetical protein
LVSLKYGVLISFALRTPSMGNNSKGSNDVTAREHDSVVQYIAIIMMAYAQLAR